MPFKSEKQRRWMWANKPEMARKWAKKAEDKGRFTHEEAVKIGNEIGVDWDKTDQHQFHLGLNVEMEHKQLTGGDPIKTGKVALDHIKEVPDYYTKLKEHVEKSFVYQVGLKCSENFLKAKKHDGKDKKDKKKKGKSGVKKVVKKVKDDKKGKPRAKGKKKIAKKKDLKVSSQSGRTTPWNPKSKYTKDAHKRRPPSVPKKKSLRPYATSSMDRPRQVQKETSIPSSMVDAPQRETSRQSSKGDVKTHSKRADTTRTRVRGRRKYTKSIVLSAVRNALKKGSHGIQS